MELRGSVLEFLENKSVLITGATGFLAKIMVEKILRVQPNVKKLYLLVRAADSNAAIQRFHSEIIGKELFRVVKEKWGANFGRLVSEKISLVAGDISVESLLLKDTTLVEEMYTQLDVVVNLAATTDFDGRYDVSLGINAMGAKNVLEFAKRCAKVKLLLHVSTAYICGEKEGIVIETPYKMGETLNDNPDLDIEAEIRLADETLNDLRAKGATEKAITLAMKDLGIKRAKTYGWPNTYVFTKAMGEMLVGGQRENLHVVIIRPTIVTSTYKEPFPGWIDGVRTFDSIAIGYGKGRLTFFLGDVNETLDMIPCDMVVNAMIVAMAAAAHGNINEARDDDDHLAIYHVGSSVRNPLRFSNLQDYLFRYFTAKPWINKDGKPVKVGKPKILQSMASFNTYMTLRYLLFLKGLEVANIALCHYFEGKCSDLNRRIKLSMRLAELYRPYLFFNGVFDDMNTERLRMRTREYLNTREKDMFYFDPTIIDWNNYFMNIHIPGAVKFVFR